VNIQAKRIVQSASDMVDVDTIAETCQFFSTLLVLQGVSGVDEEDKTALLPKLRLWKQLYRGRLASKTSERCLSLLTDDPYAFLLFFEYDARCLYALDQFHTKYDFGY
jgi:hypothetical protein